MHLYAHILCTYVSVCICVSFVGRKSDCIGSCDALYTEGLRKPGWYFWGDPWLEMDWGHVDYTWSLKYVSLLGVSHSHLIALLTLCWYSVPQDLQVHNHAVDSVWALPVCLLCPGPLGDNTARTGSRSSNIEHVWTLDRNIELLMNLCQSHFSKHRNVSINNWKHSVNDGECKD